MSHGHSGNILRKPAVAGVFYPLDRKELQRTVDSFLANTEPSRQTPKALIVPHAGYIYSGEVAAAGFGKLKGAPIQNIILMGPSHHAFISGSATSATPWLTPLGEVQMSPFPGLPINEESFDQEHSLEVHLPFLQTVLPEATIQPILVGDEEPENLATTILAAMNDSLIVASSDLSHFLSYQKARTIDHKSIETILQLNPKGSLDACGELGIRALMLIARKKKWTPSLIMARNSGDVVPDKTSVVGYASFEFASKP